MPERHRTLVWLIRAGSVLMGLIMLAAAGDKWMNLTDLATILRVQYRISGGLVRALAYGIPVGEAAGGLWLLSGQWQRMSLWFCIGMLALRDCLPFRPGTADCGCELIYPLPGMKTPQEALVVQTAAIAVLALLLFLRKPAASRRWAER